MKRTIGWVVVAAGLGVAMLDGCVVPLVGAAAVGGTVVATDRRPVGIIAGADAAAGHRLAAFGPHQAKPFELPPGAARDIKDGRQSEDPVGNRLADRLAGCRPDQAVAAQPGVERRGVVVHAVAPQHHIAARALRRLGCEGGAGDEKRHSHQGQTAQILQRESPHPPDAGAPVFPPPLAGEGVTAASGWA